MSRVHWIRKAVRAWKNRPRGIEDKIPTRGINRRELFKRFGKAAALAVATAHLQACTAFITKEYGFNREYDTRKPRSVREIVEHIPYSGLLEFSFVKEKGIPGRIVGATVERSQLNTVSRWELRRDVRSLSHTHPIHRDARFHTYMSPADFDWVIHRLDGQDSDSMNVLRKHVLPMRKIEKLSKDETRHGKGIGFSSVKLGNRWLWLEKNHPDYIRHANEYYHSLEESWKVGRITDEEYLERVRDFWSMMKDWGLRVHLTPYPGNKRENGFIVPVDK